MAQDVQYSNQPLFIREYKLIIGTSVNTSKVIGQNNSFKASVDLDTRFSDTDKSSGSVKIVSDLQITFDIKKDNNKDPNIATINVYNLSADTIAYINNNLRNNLAVALMVGYQGDTLPLVFKGTVQWVNTKREGTDKVTELHCRDGGINLALANTSRSYPRGTKISTMLQEIAGDLGTPTGHLLIDNDAAISSSASFCGNTGETLEGICKSIDHSVSIQDGSVYITPQDMRRQGVCYYVSKDSGLIGSPEAYHDDIKPAKKVTKSSTKRKRPTDGVTFEMLMHGAIVPDKTIYLKSDEYDGYFKVNSVTHTGDYYGANWITKVTASSVSTVASKGAEKTPLAVNASTGASK